MCYKLHFCSVQKNWERLTACSQGRQKIVIKTTVRNENINHVSRTGCLFRTVRAWSGG